MRHFTLSTIDKLDGEMADAVLNPGKVDVVTRVKELTGGAGMDIVAEVMREIGYKSAYVFHGLTANGKAGMDEISTLGPIVYCRFEQRGDLESFILQPEEMGIKKATAEELAPHGSPEDEALGLVRVLSGKANGARVDAVCLNAAPMFLLAGRVEQIKAGVELARELVFSGKAIVKLQEWVSCQNLDSDLV